jgi:hypothetical protein
MGEDGILERRASRLEYDNCSGEFGPGVSNEEWWNSARRMRHQDHRLSDVVKKRSTRIYMVNSTYEALLTNWMLEAQKTSKMRLLGLGYCE